jgi:hypothetical protein
MPYRSLEPVSKQLTIVIGLTVVGFMAFGLALSYYRNIIFEETLKTIGSENEKLQAGIEESQHILEYYQSAQYKDKFAKENMGRVNPGEKMIIIGTSDNSPLSPNFLATAQEQASEAAYEEYLRELPVYVHWKLFLFEKDKIDDLKKGRKS